MVPEWRQYDESIASIHQGKGAEPVEDPHSVGDGGKQPVEIVLVDALREESDNS